MTVLYLHANRLRGPLPAALAALTRLRYLRVDGNAITGVLPPQLARLRLSDVRFGDNAWCHARTRIQAMQRYLYFNSAVP